MRDPNLTTANAEPKAPTRIGSGDWLDRIAQLDALIAPLTDERAALKQQLLESKSEIKPGDIITWNKGKRMARVLNIIPWVCGEPMWKVVNIRKDGTEGSICEVRPYDKPMRSNDGAEPPEAAKGKKYENQN